MTHSHLPLTSPGLSWVHCGDLGPTTPISPAEPNLVLWPIPANPRQVLGRAIIMGWLMWRDPHFRLIFVLMHPLHIQGHDPCLCRIYYIHIYHHLSIGQFQSFTASPRNFPKKCPKKWWYPKFAVWQIYPTPFYHRYIPILLLTAGHHPYHPMKYYCCSMTTLGYITIGDSWLPLDSIIYWLPMVI